MKFPRAEVTARKRGKIERLSERERMRGGGKKWQASDKWWQKQNGIKNTNGETKKKREQNENTIENKRRSR